MTIGIGVLASEGQKKPDHLILLADTKGSFGDDYSMNRLHKLFLDPEMNLYTASSGKMDKAVELFKTLTICIREIPLSEGYGRIFSAVHMASDCYKRARFKYDVLPVYAHPPQSIPDDFDENSLGPTLLEEWQKFDFGCQMIVGAFDVEGKALLFVIDGNGEVHNCIFPGFTAIGSGANNAMFWLSYRHHNLGFTVKRAAYHAFEAKLMAEASPFVNDQIDMIVANKDRHYILTRHTPSPEGTPITVAELRKMLKKYGVRETDNMR
jgi:Proteasome subunit